MAAFALTSGWLFVQASNVLYGLHLLQITVSRTQNHELLRGLKGAGTVFGIVTEVTFQLFNDTTDVYAGYLILPDDSNFTTVRWALRLLSLLSVACCITALLLCILFSAAFVHKQTLAQCVQLCDAFPTVVPVYLHYSR